MNHKELEQAKAGIGTRLREVTAAAVGQRCPWSVEVRPGRAAEQIVSLAENQAIDMLVRQRLVLYNPAAELEMPRAGARIPRAVLTAAGRPSKVRSPTCDVDSEDFSSPNSTELSASSR